MTIGRTGVKEIGFGMNYLKVIGFVVGFLLILTFLFYVIGIYNIE